MDGKIIEFYLEVKRTKFSPKKIKRQKLLQFKTEFVKIVDMYSRLPTNLSNLCTVVHSVQFGGV